MGAGSNADNKITGNQGVMALKDQSNRAYDPRIAQALQGYGAGKGSLSDILKQFQAGNTASSDPAAKQKYIDANKQNWMNATREKNARESNPFGGTGVGRMSEADLENGANSYLSQTYDGDNAAKQAGDQSLYKNMVNQLATDPLTGSKLATDQVRSNPMLSGMFGEGGQQDRWGQEEQRLASQGYSLQPEDGEAYGQASDNIARMYGQQENSLSQALASRGLSAGASGAAGAGFSGLMGNKYEQQSNAQRKIADDRMKMTQERVGAIRGQLLQSNQLANSAIGDQYSRNQQGVQAYGNMLKDSAKAGEMEQGQANTEFEQVQASKGPGLGDILGGVGGTLLGAASGSLGSSLGGGLGKKLGGVSPKSNSKDTAYGDYSTLKSDGG